MKKQALGFIGLGVMGAPMAQHLAMAGHDLTIYDLNEGATAKLQAEYSGIKVAASPVAVAAASEIVVTMLPSGREVRETVFGDQGLLQGFTTGSLLLDTSSSEPWLTKEIAGRLADAGVAMVDAPVSGAEVGAIDAELVFMVGGDDANVARVRPLLDVMGRQSFHLGPIGAGHAMKSINNLITAVTFMATAEGLIIGKRYGLDPAVMNDVLNVSTGMSWISQTHIGRRIISRRFDDPFKLDLMMKDIDIALRVARDQDLELPLSDMTQTLWRQAQSVLAEGSSVSELVRTLEIKTGVELTSAESS
jgi:3-hydroxyisobutyrate dehydrogenase-like beta-hydroxyacid dehydrogenase